MRDEDNRAARHRQASAATDREDLLAILTMRFGIVPDAVCERIAACHDLETLERLVLVAANVPTWEVFLAELDGQGDDFKVVGARYDPLSPLSPPQAPSSGDAAHGADNPRPETYLIQIQPRSKEH
ncbi:MAG TPA: hypothetical protein VF116_21045 [Ktedonobacterales bacterium]